MRFNANDNSPNKSFALSVSGWYERLSVILDGPTALDESDLPAIERFAREFMARGAGQRLRDGTTETIRSRSVQTYRCRFCQQKFYHLSQWATAQGATSTLSEDKNYRLITLGAKTVQIPLASLKIKINGTWVEMSDMTAVKEGEWYIPADGAAKMLE